jgi:hypothetical protein
VRVVGDLVGHRELALDDAGLRFYLHETPFGDPGDDELDDLALAEVLAILKARRDAEPVRDTETLPLAFREVDVAPEDAA